MDIGKGAVTRSAGLLKARLLKWLVTAAIVVLGTAGLVLADGPPLTIAGPPIVGSTATVLPASATAAATKVPFSQIFSVTGGVGPYTWSLAGEGALPDGLTLNSSTGEISGTPTASGLFPITLQATDSLGAQGSVNWTLSFSDGLRPAWPRELQRRSGTGNLPESYSPMLADLNGDGKDEAIVTDLNTLYVVSSDGTTQNVVLPGTLTTPAVADLDGDGQKEIIVTVANSGGSNVIYAFHPDLTLLPGFPAGGYANGALGYVSSPVVEDFESDGQLKIALVASPSDSNDPAYGNSLIMFVDSQGQMLPGWPQAVGPHLQSDAAPAVASLYVPFKKELIVTTRDGYIYTCWSDGYIRDQWRFDYNVDAAWPPVLADVKGDGNFAIAVKYHSDAGNFVTLLDYSSVMPGWPQLLPDGGEAATPSGVVAADIDGDGIAEVITASSHAVYAFRASGELQSSWPAVIPDNLGSVNINSHPVAADINGDGQSEILINTTDSDHNSRLVAIDSNGRILDGSTGFPKNVSVGSEVRSTPAVGDVDGNGNLDLLVRSEDGFLWAWEMPQAGSVNKMQWPMFRRNPQHKGAIDPSYLEITQADNNIYTVVGTTSPPQAITIKNFGERVVPVAMELSGDDSSMFSLTPGTCGSLSFTLAPAESCTVYVTFTPASLGYKYATVTATTTDPVTRMPWPTELYGEGRQSSYPFSYTKYGSGSGTVTSSTGTSYSDSGSESVPYGTTVVLTATPQPGSTFTGWGGLCGGTGECTWTMYGDSYVSANFTINSYSMIRTVVGNGSMSGPATVTHGADASYTFTPAAGYHVADVVVDGVSVGPVTSYSLSNVTASHTITATFYINYYSITASAGANGSVSGPASAMHGASASYTIAPATGYHVADVLVDGVSVGAVTSYSFTNVTAAHTISASFAIDSYSITATAGLNGSITGPASVGSGGSASYSITPATGYHVADVVVDGVSVGAVTSYSFSNVTANHTISASFAIDSYSITAAAGANGSISGPATANYGATATYTITPGTGYHVADVLVDGVSVGAVTSYSFSNVTVNHTISASFTANSYTITLNAGPNGSISGPATVTYGASANYTITPATGYEIAEVVVDGVSYGKATAVGWESVISNHTISATFAIQSYNITATAGANGAIAGPASVTYGSSASYTITSVTGYHVADVLVDGVSVGAVTSYNFPIVTATHTISATFAINRYTVTPTVGPNGSISGPETIEYGGSATYTFTPASGYRVSNVGVDGASIGPVSSYSFTNVTANHTLSVFFEVDSYTISITVPYHGSISGPATVMIGESATYTITPATGYHLVDLVVDGQLLGPISSYTLTNVTANHSIGANFAPNWYTITASSTGGGTMTGFSSVAYGDSVTYTMTPLDGHYVADVLVDGVSVGAVTSYTFTNVTANHTISASFGINSYSISATAGANGSISGPASTTYGSSASYSIIPAAGYHVADVVVDGVSVGAVTSYTLIYVSANHSISASFAINSYSINATAGANGSISGPATATYGANAAYTITPAAGYRVADVVVDGASVGAVSSYTFANVTANHTISATFAALADLTATSVASPTSATRGRSISVSAALSNQGGGNAGSFKVAFYLSLDGAVSSSDVLLGTQTVSSLNAGGTTTVNGSFTVPAGMATGKYYVGVIVDSDSVVSESNESNNTRAAAATTTIK